MADRYVLMATVAAAMVVTSLHAAPAFAQGQTRTLEDLVAEYRAQCGKNGSKERLLLAFDRAIRATKDRMRIKLLNRRRDLVANPQGPVCPPPPVLGTAPPGNAPLAAPPSAENPVEDVCKRPAPNPRAAECRRFQLLLGRWTARKFGGTIETVLTPEGTISGTIIVDTSRMRDNGYRAGMQVLRGWRPKLAGGTWIVMADGGQVFHSNVYGREVQTSWSAGGVLVITKAAPDALGFPSGLQLRLADLDPWMRVGAR